MPPDKKSLAELAKSGNNPSQLGDPVSLKAETSDTNLTEAETGSNQQGDKSLKQKAEEKLKSNPSQLGDPVSLKAETSNTEPTEHDRGAAGTGRNTGKPKM